MSVNVSLSLFGPAINSPYDSWAKLQHTPMTLNSRMSGYWKWWDGCTFCAWTFLQSDSLYWDSDKASVQLPKICLAAVPLKKLGVNSNYWRLSKGQSLLLNQGFLVGQKRTEGQLLGLLFWTAARTQHSLQANRSISWCDKGNYDGGAR